MKHLLDIIMAIGAVAALTFGSFQNFSSECEEITENVLRLHIPANSDSEADQKIKLELRDFILEEYGEKLSGCGDLNDAENTLKAMLPEIETSCQSFLERKGVSYCASAELTTMYFTTREYENITLPAGNYDALRITLGSGEGHNWWCVIFPPLCLPAAEENADAVIPDDFTGDGVKIKFALFEFLKGLFN